MAIINNNVQNVKFLRNGALYGTHDAAYEALTGFTLTTEQDGTIILARYGSGNEVKTLAGLVYADETYKTITIIDIEGASGDVEKLREEINAKLGEGITSANTATDQLEALSGTSSDASGVTSVWGAKAYADDLISTLDYEDTAVAGQYVSQVTQVDGKIAVVRVELPSSADTAEAKKVVIAVSEDKGQIEVERGSISSSAQTIVLTDNTDGGVNFEVNIDNDTIVQDETTKELKVASAALTQYVGDEDTINISAADANNNKTVSSLLTIQKVTTGLSEEVKEEYHLVGASGNTIGDPVKIYKDSHIVSITYITDSGDTHYQNLEYVYLDASGDTKTEYVDISMLVLEAEFASGLTIENHVARGVVDPTSEVDSNNDPFLTVGADGFKVDGIKDEIAAQLGDVVADLDADESGSTEHITVNVVEEDGVITTVAVEEDNIANADDLAELSAKTVTALTSTNGSITADIDDAVGCKTYDIQTDADKIQMSGFSAESTSSLSGIAESDSIATAFEKANAVITENERVTAGALTDLNTRVDTISGDVDTIKNEYISGVSVNGNAVTVANHVAPISITSASGATTASTSNAIVVDTDASGNITLGLNYIDCGTY